jgi:hypothetical protein
MRLNRALILAGIALSATPAFQPDFAVAAPFPTSYRGVLLRPGSPADLQAQMRAIDAALAQAQQRRQLEPGSAPQADQQQAQRNAAQQAQQAQLQAYQQAQARMRQQQADQQQAQQFRRPTFNAVQPRPNDTTQIQAPQRFQPVTSRQSQFIASPPVWANAPTPHAPPITASTRAFGSSSATSPPAGTQARSTPPRSGIVNGPSSRFTAPSRPVTAASPRAFGSASRVALPAPPSNVADQLPVGTAAVTAASTRSFGSSTLQRRNMPPVDDPIGDHAALARPSRDQVPTRFHSSPVPAAAVAPARPLPSVHVATSSTAVPSASKPRSAVQAAAGLPTPLPAVRTFGSSASAPVKAMPQAVAVATPQAVAVAMPSTPTAASAKAVPPSPNLSITSFASGGLEIDISQPSTQATQLLAVASNCPTSCSAGNLHTSLDAALAGIARLSPTTLTSGDFRVTQTQASGLLKLVAQPLSATPISPPASSSSQPTTASPPGSFSITSFPSGGLEIDISQSSAQATQLLGIASSCSNSCPADSLHSSIDGAMAGFTRLQPTTLTSGNYRVTDTVQSGLLKFVAQPLSGPPSTQSLAVSTPPPASFSITGFASGGLEIDISQSSTQATQLLAVASGCSTSCSAGSLHSNIDAALGGYALLQSTALTSGDYRVTDSQQSGILKFVAQPIVPTGASVASTVVSPPRTTSTPGLSPANPPGTSKTPTAVTQAKPTSTPPPPIVIPAATLATLQYLTNPQRVPTYDSIVTLLTFLSKLKSIDDIPDADVRFALRQHVGATWSSEQIVNVGADLILNALVAKGQIRQQDEVLWQSGLMTAKNAALGNVLGEVRDQTVLIATSWISFLQAQQSVSDGFISGGKVALNAMIYSDSISSTKGRDQLRSIANQQMLALQSIANSTKPGFGAPNYSWEWDIVSQLISVRRKQMMGDATASADIASIKSFVSSANMSDVGFYFRYSTFASQAASALGVSGW